MPRVDPSNYSNEKGEVRSPQQVSDGMNARFTPGSILSQKAEWLAQAGLAGIDMLSGGEVQWLASESGVAIVQDAMEYARKIGEETGVTPEVYALDLAELARMARTSSQLKRDKQLAYRVNLERTNVFEKIARSAGEIAVEDTKSETSRN